VHAAVIIVLALMVTEPKAVVQIQEVIAESMLEEPEKQEELKVELEQSGDVKSVFSFAPNIEKKLEAFRMAEEKHSKTSGLGFGNFIMASLRAWWLSLTLTRELRRIMRAQAKEKQFTAAQRQGMETLFKDYRDKIDAFLDAVRDAAQFHTYERLFSLWHIFHIPLVYMMVFSAFYHVYAVHAY
jgi:hypothetical protein